MADLLWSLVTPLVTLAVIFFLVRFFAGMVSSAVTGKQGGGGGGGRGGGGFGLIAVGWIVSASIKVAGAVFVAVLNGVVLPLLGALGRGASSGWKAGVHSTARRASASPWTTAGARAGSPWANPAQPAPEPYPSIFSRRFWWATAEEVHFARWERDHHKSTED